MQACALSRKANAANAAHAQQPQPDREAQILTFTDGAWNPDEGQFEAGAGYAEFEVCSPTEAESFDMRQVGTYTSEDPPPTTRARLTHVWGGPVEVGKPSPPHCIGATKQSNNTAELTALYYALRRALGRACDAPAEDIHTDSLYARNVTLGVWRGKRRRHAAMIRHLRGVWMQIQAKRGRGAVRILHVRSHVGVPGNELADKTAERAMENENEARMALKAGKQPQPKPIDLEWARAQMRAIIGSARLHPPPQPPLNHPLNPPSTPSPTSYTHPRVGVG